MALGPAAPLPRIAPACLSVSHTARAEQGCVTCASCAAGALRTASEDSKDEQRRDAKRARSPGVPCGVSGWERATGPRLPVSPPFRGILVYGTAFTAGAPLRGRACATDREGLAWDPTWRGGGVQAEELLCLQQGLQSPPKVTSPRPTPTKSEAEASDETVCATTSKGARGGPIWQTPSAPPPPPPTRA